MIDCVMYVIVQASVVRKIDSPIHFINLYPMESAPMDSAIIGFPNTYPPDRDLSDGQLYPAFEQQGPENNCLQQLLMF